MKIFYDIRKMKHKCESVETDSRKEKGYKIHNILN